MVDALRLLRGRTPQSGAEPDTDLTKAVVNRPGANGLGEETDAHKPHNRHHLRSHVTGRELSQSEDDREQLAQQRRLLAVLQVATRIATRHRNHHHTHEDEQHKDVEDLMLRRRMLNTFNIQLAVRQALLIRSRASGTAQGEEEDEGRVDDLASAFVKLLSKDDLKALELIIPSENNSGAGRDTLSPNSVADLVIAVAGDKLGGAAKTQAFERLQQSVVTAGTNGQAAPALTAESSPTRTGQAEYDLSKGGYPTALAKGREGGHLAAVTDETRFEGRINVHEWLGRECGVRMTNSVTSRNVSFPDTDALMDGMNLQTGSLLMVDIARRQRIALAAARGEIPPTARPSADIGTVRGLATAWMLERVREGVIDGQVEEDQRPPMLKIHVGIMGRLNALRAA